VCKGGGAEERGTAPKRQFLDPPLVELARNCTMGSLLCAVFHSSKPVKFDVSGPASVLRCSDS